MERDDERIGLNLGSMLPWSAIPIIGLPTAAWMTRKAGCCFWQVLPLRGVTVEKLKKIGSPIRFVEPAWNPTTWRAHLLGKLGAEGMQTKLQDPLFFPDPWKCRWLFGKILKETNAQPIYHQVAMMYEGGLVEVHPELRMTPERLANTAQRMEVGKPYVIDLLHLRRPPRSGGTSPLGQWEQSLLILLPFTSLIHVQAIDRGGWQDFINGEPTELAQMLRFIRDWGYTGPFVVEFDPRSMGLSGLFPWILAKNLRLVRERIEENL